MQIEDVWGQLRDFAREREWQPFHTPKNLAMALAGEVGELNALLQWVRAEDTEEWLSEGSNRAEVESEVADILAYLLHFSDAVRVDPVQALEGKLRINEARYPADLSRGSALKYTKIAGTEGRSRP